MNKIPMGVAALLAAGIAGLGCTNQSGLHSGAGKADAGPGGGQGGAAGTGAPGETGGAIQTGGAAVNTAANRSGGATSSDAARSSTTDVRVGNATVLASGQLSPWAIAIDATNVYWFNLGTDNSVGKMAAGWSDGQVLKCAKSGCNGIPTVLVSGRQQSRVATPLGFATDGTDIYWSDDGTSPLSDPTRRAGGLLKCSVDGCNDSPLGIGPNQAWGLAVAGTNVYWTDFTAEILTCPIAGCGIAPKALWSAGNSPITLGIAVDGTSVYWSTEATDGIMKCAIGGCNNAPTQVMSDVVPAIMQIALDADNVYFVDYSPMGFGQVLACAKTGCADHPQALATGLNSPTAIATDGVSVYWTEISSSDSSAGLVPWPGAGVVRKCSGKGCNNTPATLAFGLNAPIAIAVDDGYVYWAESGAAANDGRIASLPK